MRYISLDIGSKTIGVASSLGQLASSLTTIRFEHDNLASGLEKLIKQVDFSMCEKIIIGYPLHLSGEPSESSLRVDIFVKHLKELVSCPIILVDERYSTIEASSVLSELQVNHRKQRKIIDQMAAVMILQRYLDAEAKI
jgi:putative Holliday junction resolvase